MPPISRVSNDGDAARPAVREPGHRRYQPARARHVTVTHSSAPPGLCGAHSDALRWGGDDRPVPKGEPLAATDVDPGASTALREALDRAGVVGPATRRLQGTIESIIASSVDSADRRRSGQVDRLLATAARVSSSLDLETVLAIVEDARVLLEADSGDILLWDKERDRLRVVAVSQRPTDLLAFEMRFGEGCRPRPSSSAGRSGWTTTDVPGRCTGSTSMFGSVICAPLIFRGDAIGALNLHAVDGRRFGPADAALLNAFAGHAALAIDHARRFENEVRLRRDLAEMNAELNRSLAVPAAARRAGAVGRRSAGHRRRARREPAATGRDQDHIHRG